MIKKILLMAVVVACFSAYAIVGQAEERESVRSNTLTIHVAEQTKPGEKPLPGRPGHVPPGQLNKND